MTAEAKAAGRPRNKIRETGVDRAFNIVNYTILTIFLLVILYPLIYVVSASFSDGAAVICRKSRALAGQFLGLCIPEGVFVSR